MSADELLTYLRQFLPEYMVPSAVVVLDELPRTPNHKVDLNALPAPRPAPDGELGPPSAPSDELERALAAHWGELLRRDQVGTDSDFFRLGGNSLLVMRVLAFVQKTYGVQVPARHLFENPTISALACYIREHTACPVDGPSALVEPAPGTGARI
ncbi:phosphopantetheine-binding protein [Micromonospora eburnea]|uniref:AMP-binding enzyme C-terminal domain-containing protein n=1 Tax=Micromonospora eburnea TaxID=227316 RepID=A0A1C6V1Z6_9ACTN|nr:phosphopantetheine-binding protein [Micromonospora eburnea]SCL60164.1 AMP-binding enzyme C-terminal domain-containing protein [Micromonospora eburnea]